jgi:mono/diheme cytochrome c family protein
VIFKLLSSIPLLLALTSCRCQSGGSSEASKASPEAQLIARGRAVYVSNCTACHATNPKLHGSQGPDVYGSSKELLTARILEAKYPEGYKPKRESAAMPALPHLKNDIDALHAYLNAP